MLQDLTNSWTACLLLVVEVFSLQKLIKMLEEMVVGWREVRWICWMRQNLIKTSVCSTVEALIVWCGWALSWRRIGPFLLTYIGSRHCSFGCISSICWAYFSNIMVSPGFRKLLWIRWATDHQTVTMTGFFFFWCRCGFGKCFGASFWSSHWASCHQLLYKSAFHCTSQSNWEMIFCCCVD